VKVPNVESFELASVKDIQPGSETASQAANEVEDQPETQASTPAESAAPRNVSIRVDTKTNILGVFQAEKLIAAYPVTIGSAQTASPIGDWKVRGIAKLPRFRYDKEMLEHGRRSGNFHMLPPGPRNPVGVMWIALNKKGIGIHGTNDPGSIGRAVSHGCIRLANWDVVRLATKIKAGDNVLIH
jgi:lipoprotein-anchoring transpeptidase ErfK/SrfK